ncbi:MAG: exopolyphosphatase, partial [Woeseiaceae bacterium]
YLAFLLGSQRHNLWMAQLRQFPKNWRVSALRVAMLLRLAVLLNRSRKNDIAPALDIAVGEKSITLHFDAEWLATNPLTVADLEQEQTYLADAGYGLHIGTQ